MGKKGGGELMIRIYKYVFPREFDDRSETNEEIGEYGGGGGQIFVGPGIGLGKMGGGDD